MTPQRLGGARSVATGHPSVVQGGLSARGSQPSETAGPRVRAKTLDGVLQAVARAHCTAEGADKLALLLCGPHAPGENAADCIVGSLRPSRCGGRSSAENALGALVSALINDLGALFSPSPLHGGAAPIASGGTVPSTLVLQTPGRRQSCREPEETPGGSAPEVALAAPSCGMKHLSLTTTLSAGTITVQRLLGETGTVNDTRLVVAPSQQPPITRTAAQTQECDGSSAVNQYVFLQQIGGGRQGQVWTALDYEKAELRAIKIVPRLFDISRAAGTPIDAEVAVLRRCRHPHIVTLYEVIDDPEQRAVYIVMRYVEKGPLVSIAADGTVSRGIPPEKLLDYACQLASGLHYLHRQGILHRDVKPDNMLLGNDDMVCLADFGISELFGREDGSMQVQDLSRGTCAFQAPECFVGPGGGASGSGSGVLGENRGSLAGSTWRTGTDDGVDGKALDVWAFGMSLYVMLYGTTPWPIRSRQRWQRDVLHSPIPYPDTSGNGAPVGSMWASLLQSMLERDPRRRPSMGVIKTTLRGAKVGHGTKVGGGLTAARRPVNSLPNTPKAAHLIDGPLEDSTTVKLQMRLSQLSATPRQPAGAKPSQRRPQVSDGRRDSSPGS